MKSFAINDKKISDHDPCFIIAEMAWSHDGSLENAKKIVKAAFAAKADSISIHLTYMPEYMVQSYKTLKAGASKAVAGSLYKFLSEKNLSESDWSELIKYAKSLNLIVLAMCNDNHSVDFAIKHGIDSFVLSPASMIETELIKNISKTGKPIFIRIGGAYSSEIDDTVALISKNGSKKIALIHGFQSFPTEPQEMNMNFIETLKKKYLLPVGFADHVDAESSLAISIPLVALAKGANIIEKHITHDRSLKGIDHESALNPDEFAKMVEDIRIVEKAFGKYTIEHLSEKELNYRNVVRKRVVALADLSKDEEITREKFILKRANDGIYPNEFEGIIGRRIKKPLKKDEPLTEDNIR